MQRFEREPCHGYTIIAASARAGSPGEVQQVATGTRRGHFRGLPVGGVRFGGKRADGDAALASYTDCVSYARAEIQRSRVRKWEFRMTTTVKPRITVLNLGVADND